MEAGKPTQESSNRSSASESSAPSIPAALFANPAIQLVLIALVGFLAYSNTFHVPFIFDDESSIVDNQVIRDLGKFLAGAGYSYNPRRFVGYLTIALNYRLGGLDVTGYHVFNLAVHVISAFLVYALVRLTLRTPFFGMRSAECGVRSAESKGIYIPNSDFRIPNFQSLVPFFAALLFVSHPIQTQAVTYIVQRLASLATLFFLLSLVLYASARLCDPTRKNRQRWGLYLLSLVSAIIAMRTKEITFTLPVVVALYEFLFFVTTVRKRLLFLLPVLLMLLIVPLSLFGTGKPIGELISDVAEKTRVQTNMPRGDYLFTQFRVIVTYLRLLILPVDQNLDYDYPISRSFLTPPVFLSFLLLLALLALAGYLLYRSRAGTRDSALGRTPESRLIAFGILWFFITLSVESSFIPIVDVIFEHRLYLPSVGAFIAVSSLAAFLLRDASPWRASLAMTAVVLILAGATFARNSVWRDAVTLAEDMARKSPRKARPHFNLALALDRKGRTGEALEEAEIAAGLAPEEAKPHNLIGNILGRSGVYDKAIAELTKAVRLDPGDADGHANLGNVYLLTGLTQRALEHYFIAQGLMPDNAEIYNTIGTAYSISSDMKKAAVFFRHAVSLDPSRPDYRSNLREAEAASPPSGL